ncbi:MAG TPA: alpha/beta hydrolase [Nocardioides sp.]|nr:alpha/beta hydrolase [Nocardioides sp.]
MAADLLDYDDTGTGPPLVLVHGLTFSRRTWDPVVERLRDRFRCVAIDLPGHGDSTGSGASPAVVVERLHATLAALGVEDPVVVGHSAGTMTAIGYAAQHPVRGIVDVDQPLVVGPFAGFVQQLGDALRGPDFTAAFAPFEDSIGVDRLPEPERSRVAGTRRVEQALVLDHWHTPLTMPPDEMQALVDGLLDATTAPFLYVAAEEPPAPVRDHLAAHVDDLQVVVLPSGSGHLAHLAHPDRFAQALVEFCGHLDSAG